MRYSDSGVDIDAGNKLTARIRRLAADTHNASVLGGIGGFAAVYEMPAKFRAPLLVSATDGVGTKLKLAAQLDRHDSVGIDLVAMCVNDIIVHGAEPLYFLDYFASGKLDVAQAEAVIRGIARGCEIANCALAGGETAEMPGFYARGEYDLAGFAVGAVDKENLITPARVSVGDVMLGLASSGAHANGFSLIRKVLEVSGDDLAMTFDDSTLGDALIAPTKIYVRALLRLFDEVQVSALAHITGGGLLENPPRVLPDGMHAEIHRSAWEMPAVFDWLQRNGEIADEEMLRTFNCGIGMLVMVRAADVARATKVLTDAGETVFSLGEICAGGNENEKPTVMIRD